MLGPTVRHDVFALALSAVQFAAFGSALGFLLWAGACLVQGYSVAKERRAPRASVLSFLALRDSQHPVHIYTRGLVSAIIGFVVALGLGFALVPFVPGVP